MKLTNEFTVAAPIDRTWATLLDVPRVASALPGARIEPGRSNGDYRGVMKVKVGPVSVEYAGTARLEELDEDERTATFFVQGSGGQGTAAATIVNRLAEVEGGTRVTVETDLRVTGRAAQFGRGLMEDVSARMLGEFATRLEREILSGPPGAAPRAARPEPAEEEVLVLGAAAWQPLLRRYGPIALAGLLLLVLLLRKPTVIVVRVEK
jgi:carbon monoxide dehydrogenase subunit G